MTQRFEDTVIVVAIDSETGEYTAVTLDAREGEITVGAASAFELGLRTEVDLIREDAPEVSGHPGDVVVRNADGIGTVLLEGADPEPKREGEQRAQNGHVRVKNSRGRQAIHLDGSTSKITLGQNTVQLDGSAGNITAGGSGRDGLVAVKNTKGNTTIFLNGNNGNIVLGGGGQDGDLFLRDAADKRRIHLDAGGGNRHADATVYIDGTNGDVALGGNGKHGDLVVNKTDGTNTIHLQGSGGDIPGGHVWVKNANGVATVWLDGDGGQIVLGRGEPNGRDGHVYVRDAAGRNTIHLRGEKGAIYLGADGQDGDLIVYDQNGKRTIHLDGAQGDIVLQNADCAEEFDVSGTEKVAPGTVMVIDEDDKLRQSTKEYDKRVAGVVSGAGDFRPGIVLDKKQSQNTRIPVAVMGKVYCKVDARYDPIEVGDLLTTSETSGHAMKADDSARAFGAVIGKALRPFKSGMGLIPILVALQ